MKKKVKYQINSKNLIGCWQNDFYIIYIVYTSFRYSSGSYNKNYDDIEEDFNSVTDGPQQSSENITQQVGGASLVFAHFMPSLKSNDDFGKPSPTNSIISSDDELSDNDLQEDSNDIQESSVRESDDHLDTEENDEVQDDYEESTIRENDDQYNCNRENDDQGIQGRENDDQSNPGIENDDQCQIEDQVNWVRAIKSSNTRRCLGSSQTLSTENDDQ